MDKKIDQADSRETKISIATDDKSISKKSTNESGIKPRREAIPKQIRFEVFKRDSFACQYCGSSAPQVLLVIDHIKPVASGGTNDISNLITACEPCNNGKGARELSDNSIIERQKHQLDELNERRLQLEMMMKWREELSSLDDYTVQIIVEAIEQKSQFSPNEVGRREIQKWLKKFQLEEILDAIDTAFLQYLKWEKEHEATSESWNKAFDSVPGVVNTTRASREKPYLRDMYYIRGILRNRLHYLNERECLGLIESAIKANADIEGLKGFAKQVSSWTIFREGIENFIDEQEKIHTAKSKNS